MSQNQPTNPQPGNNNPPANTNNPQPTNTDNNQPTNTGNPPAPTTSRFSIDPKAPVGILTFTQPAQSVTSYYKIGQGQPVTFGWEFSLLSSTPAFLTVSAVANGNTYAVGPTDGIIPGTATEVVWDLYSYQQAHPNTPLAEATYTLNIHDERGMDAGRAPGRLQPNTGLQFALYTPQPYTGLADGWTCTTCNSAFSMYQAHPAFVGILAAIIVMFLSGFGLLRHLR
ncbi:hypothetical protein BDZ94DRAFT_583925 [Collybia nuda]|uniref:DUF7137 domain-containing protein n=1 Tax=Collybia nuda TaxID=64659 RepID=A0A9P6CC59_9AGAR|nr:hypothetical protein BDZ94DRAFT_1315878 [Collybia nuda]KAF9455769.1 hypothetical protein BDZ94DRAFT_583925 [Collybia nuda]